MDDNTNSKGEDYSTCEGTMMLSPKLETKRLILTWPTPNQIEEYYRDIKDSNMFKTIHWNGPSGVQDLHDYWKECSRYDPCKFEDEFHVAIIEKESNRYIGGAALRPVDKNQTHVDVGYALAPVYHGKGFATEAVKALVYEAFSRRGAERVFANIFVGNDASKNVVEKLGFKLEGTRRRVTLKYDEWLDEWLFAITRPDWEAEG